jgi:hypothetical protein
MLLLLLAAPALAACAEMSFGETVLDTAGVFMDASEMRGCRDSYRNTGDVEALEACEAEARSW